MDESHADHPSFDVAHRGECRTGRRQLRGPQAAWLSAVRASGSSLPSALRASGSSLLSALRASGSSLLSALRASGSSLLSALRASGSSLPPISIRNGGHSLVISEAY